MCSNIIQEDLVQKMEELASRKRTSSGGIVGHNSLVLLVQSFCLSPAFCAGAPMPKGLHLPSYLFKNNNIFVAHSQCIQSFLLMP